MSNIRLFIGQSSTRGERKRRAKNEDFRAKTASETEVSKQKRTFVRQRLEIKKRDR